ncbi:hypothetical protein MATL_G00000680 [Megalops atlanticus]|uniref:Uncharacterized protein n=1 Tax=Megalops atlanticus TaxID=7932 RepID=A0A9D3QFI9_MEGAT|nr:hypothetical protein MATL_G00000680 [Megalops atlanticus]
MGNMSPCLCPHSQDSIDLLLDAVKTSNEELAQTWKKSEQWATIEQLCELPDDLLRVEGNISPPMNRNWPLSL